MTSSAPAGTPSSDTIPCLSVVMPVFNEVGTVSEVIRTVLAQPLVCELIVVDDGSTDGTWEKLQTAASDKAQIKLARHPTNRGKGAALRTAFAQVTGVIVIVQDADLEYDPQEYPAMVRPLLAGKADVVFGTRFEGAGAHRVLYFWHYLGNRLLTLLSNMATNLNLTDIEAGFKAFRREIIQQIELEEHRFGCEPELVAKLSRIPNVRIYEVPVSYYGRTYAEGKKVTWRDGISALRCIIKYNLFSRKLRTA